MFRVCGGGLRAAFWDGGMLKMFILFWCYFGLRSVCVDVCYLWFAVNRLHRIEIWTCVECNYTGNDCWERLVRKLRLARDKNMLVAFCVGFAMFTYQIYIYNRRIVCRRNLDPWDLCVSLCLKIVVQFVWLFSGFLIWFWKVILVDSSMYVADHMYLQTLWQLTVRVCMQYVICIHTLVTCFL